jgi:hypothetical protein
VGLAGEDLLALDQIAQEIDAGLVDRVVRPLELDQLGDLLAVAVDALGGDVAVVVGRFLSGLPVTEQADRHLGRRLAPITGGGWDRRDDQR